MSLAECEAKYGHLTGIGQEDNYQPSGPEEEAEIAACFATFEAERTRQEEARLAAIEAERLAAERIRLDEAYLAAIGLSFEEF